MCVSLYTVSLSSYTHLWRPHDPWVSNCLYCLLSLSAMHTCTSILMKLMSLLRVLRVTFPLDLPLFTFSAWQATLFLSSRRGSHCPELWWKIRHNGQCYFLLQFANLPADFSYIVLNYLTWHYDDEDLRNLLFTSSQADKRYIFLSHFFVCSKNNFLGNSINKESVEKVF